MRIITLLITLLCTTVATAQLPNLGRNSSAAFSPAQERKIGKLFMLSIRQNMPLIDDAIISNYLNNLGNKLVSHTKHIFHFHFFILHDNSINAFSGPGGYVGINTGLILATRTESELAAVLAHEITHVNQHHIARSIAKAKRMTIPNIAALLAAIAIGTQTNADVTSGAVAAITAGDAQSMINFTRSNEHEADRIGMETLYKAGFNPAAMPIFLNRMQKANLFETDGIPAFLQDHPTTAIRIADADNRAELYPKKNYSSTLDYYLIWARTKAFSPSRSYALKYFTGKLTSKTKTNKQAIKYGYAIAQMRNKNFTSAKNSAEQLTKTNLYQPIYQLLLATILQKMHKPLSALKILQQNIELFPDYYPLIVAYAKGLITCHQNNKARIFLNDKLATYPNSLTINNLLAKAQAGSNHLADAYQTRAKMFLFFHNDRMALIQLQQALKQPHISADTKSIIKAKISTIKGRINKTG